MMQKYLETKEEYKDCILFYRLGDFYEMFFDDALVASKELEITLTGKSCGLEERAPMCGIPYHAVDGYLNKLVSKGYKVAICEQVEDPKLAKGLVKREVTRIVTPGTNINMQALEESKNNYIMCIVYIADQFGIALADISTGDYLTTQVETQRGLLDEIYKFAPTEIICNEAFLVSGIDLEELKYKIGAAIYALEPWYFDDDGCKKCIMEHFKVTALEGLGLTEYDIATIASGALLQYLYETQKTMLEHMTHITPYSVSMYMLIDNATRRNLELTETLRDKQKRGSLLWVLDKTKTAMGGRMLRNYIEQPLIDKQLIEKRLDAIEELNANAISREELREYLNPIYDLERLLSKITYKSANPRDLIAFRNSLEMIPYMKQILKEFHSELLTDIEESLDDLGDIFKMIENAIADEPPINIHEGGIIRSGYNEQIDSLRSAKTQGKNWLAELENEDRERTGIKNLKIKY
ncbi:MAG: DNA mismatch repair protein MutS, partial [Clostridia bacterium]|nr:DNA mismatch repair protein MutS [Clostridia bacterium]